MKKQEARRYNFMTDDDSEESNSGLFNRSKDNDEKAKGPNQYFKSILKKAAVLGIIIITGVLTYSFYVTNGITMPIILLGAFGFLPIGFVLGGALVNTQFRCRILRSLLRKNYGVVHFVDGKDVFSKIKNFDQDIIEESSMLGKSAEKLYYLKKGKIYDHKGDAVSKVDNDSVKFQSGVPVIFFDTNNMIPLSLHEEETSIHAEQMAAIIKAHTTIQENKLLGRTKKIAGISVLVLIAIMGATLYYAFSTLSLLQELEPIIRNLDKSTANIIQQGA